MNIAHYVEVVSVIIKFDLYSGTKEVEVKQIPRMYLLMSATCIYVEKYNNF